MENLGYQTMRPSKKDNVFLGDPSLFTYYLMRDSYVNKIDGNYMRLAVHLPLHI